MNKNPADLQYQRFVGQHGMKAVVELLPQRTGGGQQVGLVLLFMLLKPAAIRTTAGAFRSGCPSVRKARI